MDPCFGVTIPILSRGPSLRKRTDPCSTVSTTDCKALSREHIDSTDWRLAKLVMHREWL